MSIAAYLYPWDVAGDPAAPSLVAGLGLDHVVLAAQYHATRALTPRHPSHRIVVAPHTAAYYAQPSFLSSVSALRAAGVPVRAWAVVNHVDLLSPGVDHVVNAFGDVYPWALCPGRDAVRSRAVAMAADLAALDGIDGVELEACGWYGFDHLSAHDKTGGLPSSPAMEFLLSLCFCDACESRFGAAGLAGLRERVRSAIDRRLRGAEPESAAVDGSMGTGSGGTGSGEAGSTESGPTGTESTGAPAPADREWAGIGAALGESLAGEVLAVRSRVADGFRAAMVAELRRGRPDFVVDLHASPLPHRSLAFTGVDPAIAAQTVDGLVVNCWAGPEAVAASRCAIPVYASLLAVAGLGGRPDLTAQAEAAFAAGAAGIRLYHAGLAGDDDLAAIRRLAADRPR